MFSKSETLVVLGGGIAGLAAAREALRLGHAVTVLEKASEIGGLLRTDRHQGFSFDRGGHRLISSERWVLDEIRELLGARLLLRDRRSFVFLDGKRVEYPLNFENLIRTLGLWENLRAFGSYAYANVAYLRRREDTLESWLRKRFGDYLYQRVFAGYSEKLWGVPPEKISARWAPERFSIPKLSGYVKELLRPSNPAPRTYAQQYLYPRTGIGEIVQHLHSEVEKLGGRIVTNCCIESIRRVRGSWLVRVSDSEGTKTTIASKLLSSIPLEALTRVLHLNRFRDRRPMALRYRGLRFTNLEFDCEIPVDATWIYQPSPTVRYTRLQIPSARSPEMVPLGCGSIQLEEPYDPAAPEKAVASSAIRKLLVEQELIDRPPVFRFERVEPRAYPVYRADALEFAEQFLGELETEKTIVSVGRQGRFSYVFLDRAYAEGVNGARQLFDREPRSVPGRAQKMVPVEAASIAGAEWAEPGVAMS